MRPLRLAALSLVISYGTARADNTATKAVVERETRFALAAIQLSKVLQDDTRKASLDEATRQATATLKGLTDWLAAHPRERTPFVARIVTTADKLVQAAERLRHLVETHADGELVQQAAIDALHRFNEFLAAHQDEPAPPEIAMPPVLREQLIAMLERVAREVQANKPNCDKIAAALMVHVKEDEALMKTFTEIDEARPQDQRERERTSADERRVWAAIHATAPAGACKGNAKLAEYLTRTHL